MNGANCNSKKSLMVKGAVFFGLSIITLYLLTEHSAHLLAYSSSILFFSFILLHFFMCRSHGKHGGHGGNAGKEGQAKQGAHGGCCGEHNHGEHKHREIEEKSRTP